jgi:filamentous hemagglutinin family protein
MNCSSAHFLSLAINRKVCALLPCIVFCFNYIGQSHAATPITPSGLNTQVTLSGSPPTGKTQYDITGGTRPGGGTNLFHSFGNFNVPTNNIANFLNVGSVDSAGHQLSSGLPTTNILGRITAGNPSVIFGMIQTNGVGGFGNANLFLINPAGFLFGASATINVGGMVAFTTADYLRFQGNDTLFNLGSTAQSLTPLSTAPVAAFGFLGSDPAAIAIQGSTLKVADGRSLSLIGGNHGFTATDPDNGNPIVVPNGVTMTGAKLLAPGGHINVASVAGPGEVSALDYMPTSGMAMGNITLSEGALLDVSADTAGSVRIRGGQLVIDNATISANTGEGNGAPVAIDINITGEVSLSSTHLSALTATASGAGSAGEILISSGSLNASFGTDSFVVPLIDSHTSGNGNGGSITIHTGALTVNADPFAEGRQFIISGTGGNGNGGNVTITASDARFTEASIDTGMNVWGGTGSGGNLTVKADSLILDHVSWGTDALSAKAGAITLETSGLMQVTNSFISSTSLLGDNPVTVTADKFVLDSSLFISSTISGDGGNFNVTSRVLELVNGGLISSQALGDGKAGNVQIVASERVTINGTGGVDTPTDPTASGIYTSSIGDPSLGTHGNAGNILINTPLLQLTNGGQINSTTFTAGHGGNVTIQADNILISGERPFDIGQVFFAEGGTKASGIYTKTIGNSLCSGSCGNAGNITVNTGSLTLQEGGLVDSGTTNNGSGGTITASATGQILLSGTMLDGTPGGLFSRTTGTDPMSGNGGNILVQANSVAIQNGAQISASSSGTGAAGTVIVEGTASPAQSLMIDGPGSGIFTTTSSTGPGGNISVDANAVNMTNGASISASSTGPGTTGNININAGNQFTMNNSSLTTEALHSSGGAIKITTNPNGTVQLTNSTISASVNDGAGGGGSVNIDPQSVVLMNSSILANAVFGPGGNILITTNLLLPDSASVIKATSAFGQQGTVTIQSPVAPASGKIVPLGQKPLLATSLLSQRCAALAGGSYSSFTMAGRDTLPAEPAAWLSSPLALDRSETGGPMSTADQSLIEDVPLISLRQIAPVGFLIRNFATDGSEGCTS